MENCLEAYLDIETTGLSPWNSEITVVGIHLCNGDEASFIQLVGEDATADNILEVLKGVVGVIVILIGIIIVALGFTD